MTVTLHPRRGQSLGGLVNELLSLADGDISALCTGRGGIVVGDDLARAYLWSHPEPVALTPGRPQMVPPALRAVVARAEGPLRSRAQTAGPPART